MKKEIIEELENDKVIEVNLEDVIHNSMIPYAEYVIMDRAIPRVEDGLKPVQRRILYAMYELGLTPDKPTRKCARIVGDCLGKFHPHGDSSVYGALVRMGQPFSIRNPLVDGQGNFGSPDGDSAAAMRYTEARLKPLAMELLRDIDKDTVKYANNFDDTMVEPVTLPGRFPNLLVNGASGIAVGLATNIPTHNLCEVIDGAVAMIRKPKITLEEMMHHIKGPDFPTGGFIIKQDLVKAYETGRGKIFIRAKVNIERENGKEMIVITEFPYQVNKATLQQKIIMQREAQKDSKGILTGITEVTDESDMSGIRVVIKVKKDFSANEILEELYKKTDLQISFNINMVAIAGGKPRTLSLLEVLYEYLKYQMEVVLRRAKYEYAEAKKREHILEGLSIAVNNIDEVIRIIRSSKNTPEAKSRLMETFILSNDQAQAILDMRLAKINTLEVYKLEQELTEIKNLIANLYEIIHSEEKRRAVLVADLLEIKKKYGDERRSVIVGEMEEVVVRHHDDNIVEPCAVQLMANGKIRRVTTEIANRKTRGGFANGNLAVIPTVSLNTQSDDIIKVFTSLGNCYQVRADMIDYHKPTQKNLPEIAFMKAFEANETIINIFKFDETDFDLIFFTEQGLIKKSTTAEYRMTKDSFQAIKLKDGDTVVSVKTFVEGKGLFFATEKGMCLRCESDDVPQQGRVSMGVKGINLNAGDKVVSTAIIGNSGEIYVVTNEGLAKRVILSNIPITARYRKGVKLIEFKNKNTDYVVSAGHVKTPKNLAVIGDTFDITVENTENIPIEKRETKGKPIAEVKYFEHLALVVEVL